MSDRRAATAVALHPLLADRWSPRAYSSEHQLGTEELLALLEAARWAPSAMNRQPWRFLVGRRGDETFKRIYDALLPGNQAWAGNASALIVAVAPTHDSEGRPAKHAPYELGLAVGQLVTQAAALGLHTHQMAGFSPDAIRAEFDVPDNHDAYAVIAVGGIGVADELPEALRERELAPRARQPLDEIAFSGSWGRPALY